MELETSCSQSRQLGFKYRDVSLDGYQSRSDDKGTHQECWMRDVAKWGRITFLTFSDASRPPPNVPFLSQHHVLLDGVSEFS